VAQDGTANLTYTPGDSLTTWTSYQLPFGLVVGGGLRHVGGLHRGSDRAAGTPASTAGYGVVDLMLASRPGQSLAWRVNAYNVTGKHYVAAINKSGYRYTPGAPRSYLFSLEYMF
jgi:catecholate siderophore receptor